VTPLILAIDTTGARGSLALVRGGVLEEETLLESPDGFAHVIHDEVRALLERRGIGLREMDGFASASGPGSFTGVRIGLTAMKGLAEAMGKPMFGVSNLQALAWFGERALRGTLIDARRGEVYGAVYDACGAMVSQETVGRLDRWAETLPAGDLEILVDRGFELNLDRPYRRVSGGLARAVGVIAGKRLIAGELPDPAVIDANYVRRSDAELFWKE
jgi:tRNA threonylcarbamoyladenosine biosynthesis protein TsaB